MSRRDDTQDPEQAARVFLSEPHPLDRVLPSELTSLAPLLVPPEGARPSRDSLSASAFNKRFAPKVSVDSATGCWIWTAFTLNGYGRFALRPGDVRQAHRVAHEAWAGPIGDSKQLDHLCRNRACVRPDHLEPVTAKVNMQRGMAPSGKNYRKTSCPQGHPYDETNTKVGKRGGRWCRECYLLAKEAGSLKAKAIRASRGYRNVRMVDAFGQSQSMVDWSRDERCVVTYSSLRQRLLFGAQPEAAITTPCGVSCIPTGGNAERLKGAGRQHANIKLIVAFGETKSITEWALDDRCVVRYSTLAVRLARGVDAETAILTPAHGRAARTDAAEE